VIEDSFKLIILFFPILVWSSPIELEERIINYSTQTNNPFLGSIIESGLTLNSNTQFTSYSIFTQLWVSSNLALNGKIAPYIGKNDLYHYQYIGVNYHSLIDENIYSPFGIIIGMHRLINIKNSENNRWFNFGFKYFKTVISNKFTFHWNNFFTKNENVKSIGISHFLNFHPKINLNYGINYYFQNTTFSLNLNLGYRL
tara:strand:- start:6561 stop:7157 length:597 start_codon:yes stop_codon:yes gene_type:complete